MIGENVYTGFGRGMIIDVDVDESIPFDVQVSVYCVAHSIDDKHFIRVQDAKSRAVIAPTVLMSNYTGGAWWTVQYNKPFRIRLLAIHGVHASAVAFSIVPGADSPNSVLREAVKT